MLGFLSGTASVAALSAWVLGACGTDNGNAPLPSAMLDSGRPGPEGGDAAVVVPPGNVVPGAKDRMLLSGTIVTPETIVTGQILVEGTKITCVEEGTGCAAKPGAAGATIVDTGGVIAPGLIDTHNHILYDIFDEDDWTPTQLYKNHTEWPNEDRYSKTLDVKQCLANDSQGKPAWCASTPYGTSAGSLRCEMDKWGELKGLVAGTTSIVGLPGTSAACFGSLARSIDVSQNGLGSDKVQASALFPPSSASTICSNFASKTTTAFLPHVGEGVDAKALAEWATLEATAGGCLVAPQTAITHGTAFTAAEFAKMGAAGMKLTWSPQSNHFLYGNTTNVPLALDAKLTVAIAPDWSLGGSQNMLDELRFANAWDDKNWGDRLKPKDLVTMGTLNGAKVLALDSLIGQIKVGQIADLAVFAGDRGKPYEAILAATPREVRLVMIGGTVLYGDKELEAAAPAKPGCETIDICGKPKFLCVATEDPQNKLNQTYATIKDALEKALKESDALTPEDGYNFAPLAPLVKCPK